MTAPLAHIIMLADEWKCGDLRWWVCAVCERRWDVLPDYTDKERWTCPGKKT